MKRFKRRKTDNPLHTQPFPERRSRSCSWRPLSSETISSEQQLETRSRRRLLGKIILFWQTKSHAVIVHHPVPLDCFVKVIAKNGEQTPFERLSTPRPAPKVILRSSWQVQQQQQQQPQQPATRLRRLGANRTEEESQDSRTEITTSNIQQN